MDHFIKIDIATKISNTIKLYAEMHKVKKYLIRKILLDGASLEYDVFLLDEDKMFQHSMDFKIDKKLLIDRRGNKKKEYYTYCDQWLKTEHEPYTKFKFFILKLINRNDRFAAGDLQELNVLYKELKRLKNANTKKK